MHRTRALTDPSVLWPPPEPECSEEERVERLNRDREAKKRSDAIDASLAEEKERMREQRRATGARILLLGQAESGKSTVLKNFQLHFAPAAFRAEAILWRPIIHYNMLRSINVVLEVVIRRLDDPASLREGLPEGSSDSDFNGLRRLRYSLMPLKGTEELLARRIGVSPTSHSSDPMGTLTETVPAPVSTVIGRRKTLFRWRRDNDHDPMATEKERREDFSNRRIISACAEDMVALWENTNVQRWLRKEGITLHDKPGFFLDSIRSISDEDYTPNPSDILRARIPTVGPEEHHIPVESTSALDELVGSDSGREWVIYDVGGARTQRAAWAQFFDDVTAIIFLAPISAFNQSLEEDPSVNRLVGTFAMTAGKMSVSIRGYGSLLTKEKTDPKFSLASSPRSRSPSPPISTADSMKLWRSICANKLLQDVHLVLFLNKIDLLDIQLQSGVRFSQWVPSYKDKNKDKDKSKTDFKKGNRKNIKKDMIVDDSVDDDKNDMLSVANYLIEVFHGLHSQFSPKRRKVFAYLTCATDTQATSRVIARIQEAILVQSLSDTNIL